MSGSAIERFSVEDKEYFFAALNKDLFEFAEDANTPDRQSAVDLCIWWNQVTTWYLEDHFQGRVPEAQNLEPELKDLVEWRMQYHLRLYEVLFLGWHFLDKAAVQKRLRLAPLTEEYKVQALKGPAQLWTVLLQIDLADSVMKGMYQPAFLISPEKARRSIQGFGKPEENFQGRERQNKERKEAAAYLKECSKTYMHGRIVLFILGLLSEPAKQLGNASLGYALQDLETHRKRASKAIMRDLREGRGGGGWDGQGNRIEKVRRKST